MTEWKQIAKSLKPMLLVAVVAYALFELRAELGELGEATMMQSLELAEHAAVLKKLDEEIKDKREALYELQACLEKPEDVERPMDGTVAYEIPFPGREIQIPEED